MLDKELITKLDMKSPAVWLATWFGCGLSKHAPGTVGTIGGIPLGILLMISGGLTALLIGFIITCIVGYYAARTFEDMVGEHDSGAIVIDEVAGLLLTMAALTSLSALLVFAAFFLFRVFDILKPWPVSWADKKLSGAFGVMADDVLAGVYAAICLWGLQYAGLS